MFISYILIRIEFQKWCVNNNTNKGYSVAKRVTIGKVSDLKNNTMYPNEVYFDMFYPDKKSETTTNKNRNMALGSGMYAVLDSLFDELKIPQILKKNNRTRA